MSFPQQFYIPHMVQPTLQLLFDWKNAPTK